jgi:hypothetical protein
LVSQLDLLSSIASLTGSTERGKDSEDLLSTFLGTSKIGREEVIIEATSRTAFRKGDWAMIPPYKGRRVNTLVNIELGNDTIYQLYNLKEDLKQQKNLAQSYPEVLKKMVDAYEAILGTSNHKEIKLTLE